MLKLSKYNRNHLIISDEAILHNFQEALLEIKEEDPKSFKDFLINRAVVYCYSSVDGIVEQILRRKEKTGRIVSHQDRKSTRLNSSHVAISYAVFCLKKKSN